jgi:hypothetical protein
VAAHPAVTDWSLTVPGHLWTRLFDHLFPGDRDEHGAVLACGVADGRDGRIRLLAREVIPASDGVDYVPGTRGYRQLTGGFVTTAALACREAGLAYLAAHNHHSGDHAGFSSDDLASQARGYPTLLDIIGQPVGALVVARQAAAGNLWSPGGARARLDQVRILGTNVLDLTPSPRARAGGSDERFDRQSRLFGDRGQAALAAMRVAIVGAGGVGSVLVELLSRLGVGSLVVIDPDRVDVTNLPRLLGARQRDAGILQDRRWPAAIRDWGRRFAVHKVDLARRTAKRADPRIAVEGLPRDITDPVAARALLGCDYIFLAADTMRARLVVNAIVQQYLIPGVQVGTKVRVDRATGSLLDVHTVSRPMRPGRGCLWCNGLIPPDRLAAEAATDAETRAQRYIEDPDVAAPSVITLNAVGASHAADDFLFEMLGLRLEGATVSEYLRVSPRDRAVALDEPRFDDDCPECGSAGRLARGSGGPSLPTIGRSASTHVPRG